MEQPDEQNTLETDAGGPKRGPTLSAEQTAYHSWLTKRNIDPGQLQSLAPEVYARWHVLFGQLHADSFLNQVRFELNAVRRRTQGLPE